MNWISVKDKLPEIDEVVLVYTYHTDLVWRWCYGVLLKEKSSTCNYQEPNSEKYWLVEENQNQNNYLITHWMKIETPSIDKVIIDTLNRIKNDNSIPIINVTSKTGLEDEKQREL